MFGVECDGGVQAPQQPPQQPQQPQQAPAASTGEGAAAAAAAATVTAVAGGGVDYTQIPKQLDAKFEQLATDAALRPTIISPGSRWNKKSQKVAVDAPVPVE